MRRADITRASRETTIVVSLNLDGTGKTAVDTGIPFLDHMLGVMASHGLMDLKLKARGDLQVDLHHTNEDIGIALGQAMDRALADRRGIQRIGHAYVPLDEALARAVADFSGRAVLELKDERPARGKPALTSSTTYQWGDAQHLLESLVRAAKVTLHISLLAGEDFHHSLEAVFKAVGRALEAASRINPRVKGIPSTKGRL